jgi:2-hydroxychromene-2-carboxylate isomerase
MSLRGWLMPTLSERWLSEDRLLAARVRTERRRRARGGPHRVLVFLQADDPYSALLADCLPAFAQRLRVDLVGHVVGPPADAVAPDRARLVAWGRRDADALARRHGLAFRDPGAQPDTAAVAQATRALVAAAQGGDFAHAAAPILAGLWQGVSPPGTQAAAGTAETARHLAASEALRDRLGHYLAATLFYGGEWYWGIDRLHHLEQRLQDLGAQAPGATGLLVEPDADLDGPLALRDPPPIDFYFSLRSPYSAIVAPRVIRLGQLTGAPVRLRYLLPMVMRGLPVPRAKRRYIALDAAREARWRGIPFGRLVDPVGRPVERGLALMPLAERQGRGADYLLSFFRAVWAEGVDPGTDRGLRRIAERAGLGWNEAREALHDEAWRTTAETHRRELLGLGLWGVPSFRVRDTAVWGQDRLWAVREAVLRGASSSPSPTGSRG